MSTLHQAENKTLVLDLIGRNFLRVLRGIRSCFPFYSVKIPGDFLFVLSMTMHK